MKFPWQRKSETPTHSELVPGTSQARDVLADLDALRQTAARHKKEADESLERYRKMSEAYEQLHLAHNTLLRKSCEALLVCETTLRKSFHCAQEAIQSLDETLKEQGVERFSPQRGDPADDTHYMVEAESTSDLPPGLVDRVLIPGLRFKDGEVIVPPRIVRSIAGAAKPDAPPPEAAATK